MADKSMTAAEVAAEYPEAAAALRAEGEKAGREAGHKDGHAEGHKAGLEAGAEQARREGLIAGAESERKRIEGLEAAALPGFESLLAAHKADGTKTDVDLMRAQTQAQKEQGVGEQKKIEADQAHLNGLPAPGVSQQGAAGGSADPFKAPAGKDGENLEAWAKEQWEASDKVRAEFKVFSAYHGWLKSPQGQAA